MWESIGEAVWKWCFVEFPPFTSILSDYFPTDEAYAAYQAHLLKDPQSGEVIPGCGGVRKDRWPDPRRGKGRRGGLRIIYLQIPEARVLIMLDVYDKNEASDLTLRQKRRISNLADGMRTELLARFRKEE